MSRLRARILGLPDPTQGPWYNCHIDDNGDVSFYDVTNRTKYKYEEDVTPWLPLLTPVLTQRGTVAYRQPKIPVQHKAWWKAQCGFRGLDVKGAIPDMQERLREYGDAGVCEEVGEVFEELQREFFSENYEPLTDSQKADGWPKRFLAECFGMGCERRDEVVVVEVGEWGNNIQAAARSLGVCCNLRNMPDHETGQRRAVLGRDLAAVRAYVAEVDPEERRAVGRERWEREEEAVGADAEFKRKFRVMCNTDADQQGIWDITGTWKLIARTFTRQRAVQNCFQVDLHITKPTSKGFRQIYGFFDFGDHSGILRFDFDEDNYFFQSDALPSATSKSFEYRWRGVEKGEDVIQLGSDRTLHHIQFRSPYALTGHFGSEGSKSFFSGYKASRSHIMCDGRGPARIWEEDYSKPEYERQSVARWKNRW